MTTIRSSASGNVRSVATERLTIGAFRETAAPRVYISSTATDLTAERQAVREAVGQAGCIAVGMEDTGPDGRLPIERCLEDVRSCAAYIGIIAWRYGSTPPGKSSSFTEMEYEVAVAEGKQVLLFLLHENAEWPTSRVDDPRARIVEFRSRLERNHIVASFSNSNELTGAVGEALRKLYGGTTNALPRLLPYLADRVAQEDSMAEATASQQLTKSPTTIVVHGPEGQALEKFIEHLHEAILPQYLQTTRPIRRVDVTLRAGELEVPATITRRISVRANLPPTTDRCDLAMQLHQRGAMVMLWFPVGVLIRRGRPRLDAVTRLFEYFDDWPAHEPLRVIAVIAVKYRQSSSWGRRVGLGRPLEPPVEAIAELADRTRRRPILLPPLDNVLQEEAEVWSRRPEVQRTIGRTDLIPAIRALYKANERAPGEGLPMEFLARNLTRMAVT